MSNQETQPKSILKKKKNVFEDADEDQKNQNIGFKVADKSITKKIDKKLQRNYLEKAKHRIGKDEVDRLIKKQDKKDKKQQNNEQDQEDEDDSWESSSIENEDEFGKLVNNKVQDKFLTTLAKLRTKKNDIYQQDKQFFSDSDFEDSDYNSEEDEQYKKQVQKKFSYKDMVSQNIKKRLDGSLSNDDEDEENTDNEYDSDEIQNRKNQKLKDETPFEEQERLKKEFTEKSKKLFQDGSDDDDDDENIFQVKKKTQKQIDDEEEAFKVTKKKLEKRQKRKNSNEAELLDEMWGNPEELDEKDKFLRKYILTKAWIDREDYEEAMNNDVDEEDEKRDDEIEQFEHEYNFRFEEPNGAQLVTYERDIGDSMRDKTSKRAEKRKQKQEEKQKEKQQMEEEVKRLKNVKKQEILDRLKKIQQTGGVADEEKIVNEDMEEFLEKEFDPEEYDKIMKKKFGKKYRKDEDLDETELKQYEKQQVKQELPSDEENDDEEEVDQELKKQKEMQKKKDDKDPTNAKTNIPIAIKKNINKDEAEALQNNENSDEEHDMICWYCDNCQRGLQPMEQRFDCQECPDYVLCKQCSQAQIHSHHKFKKLVVPKNCAPPDESTLQSIIQNFKICKKCDCKLNEYTDIHQLLEDEQYNLCTECFDKENYTNQKNYKVIKATKVDISQLVQDGKLDQISERVNDDVIQKLVDDYYGMDFEDVIAGGLKTKFKYTEVPKESYGLSDEQLLYADPNALNSYVSLKKLAPYRDDEGKVKSKTLKNKAKIREIEESTRLVKYQIRKENEKINKLEQKIKKLKKSKKSEKKIQEILKKIEKIKEQKKAPITKNYFKNLKRVAKDQDEEQIQSDDDDNEDEEIEDLNKKKWLKSNLTDLSQKKEKIHVSDNRLATYGIKNNN